jgi:PP-loop superfamily ATP-utilizing enzyme
MDQKSAIESAIKDCGYRFVALDLGGFRSGSLNDGIVRLVNLPD